MYDLIIIGAGPAGLAAGIYAARYKLKTLVIGLVLGGIVAETPLIENYPGFRAISGTELVAKLAEQVETLGLEIKQEEVGNLKKIKNGFEIRTDNNKYQGKALILTLGSTRRKLNVKGEDKFSGKGVTYCATCDAPLFKDKEIAVIGGGDSAVMAALHTIEYAKKVYMIDVEEKPRAKPFRLELLKKARKVEILGSHKVNEIKGNKVVSSIEIEKVKWKGQKFEETGKKKQINVQGIIIEVGMMPSSDLAKELKLELDEANFIKVDEEMKTNVKGVFAAGDIINRELKQIVSAAAYGAIAAQSAYDYIKNE